MIGRGDGELMCRRVYIRKRTHKVSEESRIYVRDREFTAGIPVAGFDPGLRIGEVEIKREKHEKNTSRCHFIELVHAKWLKVRLYMIFFSSLC